MSRGVCSSVPVGSRGGAHRRGQIRGCKLLEPWARWYLRTVLQPRGPCWPGFLERIRIGMSHLWILKFELSTLESQRDPTGQTGLLHRHCYICVLGPDELLCASRCCSVDHRPDIVRH